MRFITTLFSVCVYFSAISQPPGDVDYFDAGVKAKQEKNFTLAIENFRKDVTAKPQHGEAWYELGWCYNELKKYEDAIKTLKNAKIWWGTEPRVHYESGYANDYGGKVNDAIQDYKKCIELKKNYSAAYRQLGNIYFDIDKDYATALEYYNQYLNYSVEKDITAGTWYRKGYSEIELERFDEALISLKKAVTIDNKYIAAYNELGYAYYQLNRADEAISTYLISRQLDSTNSAACAGLGDTYRFLKKNTDEALKYYTLGARVNPKSQNCNYGAGWCYNEKGDHQNAIPYLKKAIALNSAYTAAYTELGYAYYALRRYDEAIVELNNSTKSKETAVACYYKGLCYIAKNQKAEAQSMYQKLVELKSPDADTLLKKINAM